MIKYILMLTLFISACTHSNRTPIKPNKIYFTSGLFQTARVGNGNANYSLSERDQLAGIYMLGPQIGFSGEITINDGKIYSTRLENGKLVTDHFPTQMVFNVYANCQTFKGANKKEFASTVEFEKYLAELSPKIKLFKLQGTFEVATIHVVTGVDKTIMRPAKMFYKREVETMTAVGFYSSNHRRVFTHHDSDVHTHVIDQDGHTFHLDSFKNIRLDKFEYCELD